MYERCLAILLIGLLGCDEGPHASIDPAHVPAPGNVTAATCGTLAGRVTWSGSRPVVPDWEIQVHPFGGPGLQAKQVRPNPNRPIIDADSCGVASAVVFLRNVDLANARMWAHASVLVEQEGGQFRVRQGDRQARFGFVRRGEPITMVSRDDTFYALHAEGAAYFTLMFPDPNKALERTLPQRGIVELTSGVGYYWMRAYVFVDDHPYYTTTDNRGQYQLTQVPAGKYEVVCWMPSWKTDRRERDPETAVVVRHSFRPAVERVQVVEVKPGEACSVDFQLATGMFPGDDRP